MGINDDGTEVRLDTLFVTSKRAAYVMTFPRRLRADFNTEAAHNIYHLLPPKPPSQVSFIGIYQAAAANALGFRLQQNPSSTLTLQYSTNDITKTNAHILKSCLDSLWKLAPERVRIQAGKHQDNVLLIEGTPILFEPILYVDSLFHCTPPIIRFALTTVTPEMPQQWSINIRQRKKSLRMISAAGRLRPLIDWKVIKDINSRSVVTDSIHCNLEIRYVGDIPNERSRTVGFFAKVMPPQAQDTIPRAQLCTLLFKDNAVTLTPESLGAVRLFKQYLRLEPGKTIICSVNNNGSVETEQQKTLIQKRVQEIAKQLGIPESRIKTERNEYISPTEMEITIP